MYHVCSSVYLHCTPSKGCPVKAQTESPVRCLLYRKTCCYLLQTPAARRIGATLHAKVLNVKPGVWATAALPPVKALGAMRPAMQTAAIHAGQTALEITAKPAAAMWMAVHAMHAAKDPKVKQHVMGWTALFATPCAWERSADPGVWEFTIGIVERAAKGPSVQLHVVGWIWSYARLSARETSAKLFVPWSTAPCAVQTVTDLGARLRVTTKKVLCAMPTVWEMNAPPTVKHTTF